MFFHYHRNAKRTLPRKVARKAKQTLKPEAKKAPKPAKQTLKMEAVKPAAKEDAKRSVPAAKVVSFAENTARHRNKAEHIRNDRDVLLQIVKKAMAEMGVDVGHQELTTAQEKKAYFLRQDLNFLYAQCVKLGKGSEIPKDILPAPHYVPPVGFYQAKPERQILDGHVFFNDGKGIKWNRLRLAGKVEYTGQTLATLMEIVERLLRVTKALVPDEIMGSACDVCPSLRAYEDFHLPQRAILGQEFTMSEDDE